MSGSGSGGGGGGKGRSTKGGSGGGGQGKPISSSGGSANNPTISQPMQGSQKQIDWANKIKGEMDFSSLQGKNPLLDKASNFVQSIPKAEFWIDNRSGDARSLVGKLPQGLRVGDKTYTMSKDGSITAKWSYRKGERIPNIPGAKKTTDGDYIRFEQTVDKTWNNW